MTRPRVRRFQRELHPATGPTVQPTDAIIPGSLSKGLQTEALQTAAWHVQARANGYEWYATTAHTFNSQTPALNANASTALARARAANQGTFVYSRPVECFVGGLNGLAAVDLNNVRAVVLDVEVETDTTHPLVQTYIDMLTNSGLHPMVYAVQWATVMGGSVAFSATDLWDRYNWPNFVPDSILPTGMYFLFGGWNTPNNKRKIWQQWDPITEGGTATIVNWADRTWYNYNATRQAWQGWQFVKAPTDTNTTTDYTRALGTAGDGQAIGTSYGVWMAATNRCVNGGADTNTTGATAVSSTVTRITTDAKFFTVGTTPGNCYNIVCNNAAANEGVSFAISGGAASTKYTVSFWAKLVSGAATVCASLNDNVSGNQNGTGTVLTSSWQKIQTTATTGVGSVSWNGRAVTTVQQAGTYKVDGFQIEAAPIATPYIVTDGGTASRTASLLTLTVGSTAMTPTQGWIAMRVRPRWSTTSEPYGGAATPRLWTWRTDNNNGIFGRYNESGNTVSMLRVNGGSAQTASQAWAPASGTSATIIADWDATNVGVSINGAARTTAGTPQIPTISNTFLDVGSLNASENFCGEILWMAWGSGPMTDGNASTIDAIGDTPPTPAAFPSTCVVNSIFSGFIGFNQIRTTAI